MNFLGNAPISERFGDVYFDANEPLKEREFVYASVIERIEKQNIVIAEAGFGVGLNFFSTARKALNSGKNLHFISIEKYPLSIDELREIHTHFSEFTELFNEFAQKYEILDGALTRIKLCGEKIILDLYFGDILEALDELDFRADAWFLDGFAPSKNPQMWDEKLFKRLGEFCLEGALIRSYSVAAVIRKGFGDDFIYEKIDGRAHKKEISQAICIKKSPRIRKNPWFAKPKLKGKSVLVLGGGIAGLVSALKFQNAGFDVVLCEKANHVAANGSSNLNGLLSPLIVKRGVKLGLMHLSAFLFASNFYSGDEFGEFVDFCGAKHYAVSEREIERFKSADGDILRFTRGKPYDYSFITRAAQIRPKALCNALARNLDVKLNYEFKSIKLENDSWTTEFTNGEKIRADLVIFALGSESKELFSKTFCDEFAQIGKLRGQVTHIAPAILDTPFSARAYACKPDFGIQVIGSTFDRDDLSLEPRKSDDEANIANLSEFLGGIHPQILGQNIGIRCYCGDRFPLVGSIYDARAFCEIYKTLLWTKRHIVQPEPVYYPNLLVNSAHGAHGLATAIWGAEILLDFALNRQVCATNSLLDEMNSARFLIRALKKGLV